MMGKLHRLQSDFQQMEVEGTAVIAMEEALDGVRVILEIAKAPTTSGFWAKLPPHFFFGCLVSYVPNFF